MAIKKPPVKPATQAPVHEFDPHGRHRIVTFRNGIPEKGEWFAPYEIAHFRGLHASPTDHTPGVPKGIFRVTPVTHEVL